MDRHTETRSCTGHGARSRCPEVVHGERSMSLLIRSTTGTRFELSLPPEETVEGLKRRISQKLKVPKDRLALLHKDTRLSSGRLQDFGVTDGSKLTLVPTVEAGLMPQASRPEQSIIQALESLTETQVSDFLSGRSPLTLALRVGDHMMFVQLQLAAQQSGARGSSSTNVHASHAHTGHAHPRASPGQHLHRLHHSPPSSPTTPSSASPARPHFAPAAPSPAPGLATPLPQGECSNFGNECTRKPGAVIESFVNHAPGVFSGTFSGTLHPSCQDSQGRPRRDISTILQILSDLLSATRHYQGVPPTLAHLRCHAPPATPSPPPSPRTPGSPSAAGLPSPPVSPASSSSSSSSSPITDATATFGHSRVNKTTGEPSRQTENRATRCKVERLQLLLQQRRLRRRARRDPRGPYPWLGNRKAARSHSTSSLSSEGSLDLDYDEAPWKPDVQADIGSEFVVA